MCLRWWWRNPPKSRAPTHGRGGDNVDTTSSGPFSSKDFYSVSTTSASSSSVAGNVIKDILPQGPVFYSRSEIAAATLNFSASQKIGSSAWQGVLRGFLVAIIQKPGIAKNFRRLLKNVHVLHHKNLAKVVGGCAAPDHVFVVYELVNGDTLQSCLCNRFSPGYTVLSTWRLRMQVAVDVAKGLEYVHQHTTPQSPHKYLTSSTIMVSNDTLRAKVTLVGMAVLTGEVSAGEAVDEMCQKEAAVSQVMVNNVADHAVSQRKKSLASPSSIKIKGTHGYMPPEYFFSSAISQKYDIFTFGIVLLEILKGEGIGSGGGHEQRTKLMKVSIVDEVRSIFSDEIGIEGRLRLWIDQRLKDSYPVDDAVKVASLALLCVDKDPHKRPTMVEVTLRMAMVLESAEVWEKGRSTYTGTGTLEGR